MFRAWSSSKLISPTQLCCCSRMRARPNVVGLGPSGVRILLVTTSLREAISLAFWGSGDFAYFKTSINLAGSSSVDAMARRLSISRPVRGGVPLGHASALYQGRAWLTVISNVQYREQSVTKWQADRSWAYRSEQLKSRPVIAHE